MTKKISFLVCISIVIICIDQMTKTYVQTNFNLHDTLSLIPNFLNMTYARNFGAAFGFLEEAHAGLRDIFMMSIPPLVSVLILLLIYYIKPDTHSDNKNNTLQLISLSTIFGGAVGNYIDRLHYGYVIDFIDVHWNSQYAFPTFNVADCAIVIGAFFLIVSIIKEKSHEAHY